MPWVEQNDLQLLNGAYQKDPTDTVTRKKLMTQNIISKSFYANF
jgi:hypothetical protein